MRRNQESRAEQGIRDGVGRYDRLQGHSGSLDKRDEVKIAVTLAADASECEDIIAKGSGRVAVPDPFGSGMKSHLEIAKADSVAFGIGSGGGVERQRIASASDSGR